ncbi:hypothetical protein Lal_00014119 [Lupinus albus]|nr:hypothetical protein Lal_00014119 [Lupinus albus]
MEVGDSSIARGGRTTTRSDPYYSPSLQAKRLGKFHMVQWRYEFPDGLEAQRVTVFLELNGNIYPSLIMKFYGNFQFKDGAYVILVKGKIIYFG